MRTEVVTTMWSYPIKRAVIAGGAALILSTVAMGMTMAQQTAPPAGQTAPDRSNQGSFLDALARRLGLGTAQLQQAMSETRAELGLTGRPFDGRRQFRGDRPATAAATAIGISVEQLRQELPGKSLAQVAQAHGRNPADVATALKNAANQRIEQATGSGRISPERASQMSQRIAERIDAAMSHVVPEGGPRFEGPGGPERMPGPRPGLGEPGPLF